MISGTALREMRVGSTAVTSPPSDRFQALTESNAEGLPDVTVEM